MHTSPIFCLQSRQLSFRKERERKQTYECPANETLPTVLRARKSFSTSTPTTLTTRSTSPSSLATRSGANPSTPCGPEKPSLTAWCAEHIPGGCTQDGRARGSTIPREALLRCGHNPGLAALAHHHSQPLPRERQQPQHHEKPNTPRLLHLWSGSTPNVTPARRHGPPAATAASSSTKPRD